MISLLDKFGFRQKVDRLDDWRRSVFSTDQILFNSILATLAGYTKDRRRGLEFDLGKIGAVEGRGLGSLRYSLERGYYLAMNRNIDENFQLKINGVAKQARDSHPLAPGEKIVIYKGKKKVFEARVPQNIEFKAAQPVAVERETRRERLLSVIAGTHPGKVRENNEDRHGEFRHGENYRVLVVADGMGGYEGGEWASQLVVDTIKSMMKPGRETTETDPSGFITGVLQRTASNLIRERQRGKHGQAGTTIAGIMMDERTGDSQIFHEGDSRAYVIPEGGDFWVTGDHEWTAEQVDQDPRMSKKAVGALYRHMDSAANVPTIDVKRVPRFATVLICSDGLTDLVKSDEIVTIVREQGLDLETARNRLIELALNRGGHDNITVVLARRQ